MVQADGAPSGSCKECLPGGTQVSWPAWMQDIYIQRGLLHVCNHKATVDRGQKSAMVLRMTIRELDKARRWSFDANQ